MTITELRSKAYKPIDGVLACQVLNLVEINQTYTLPIGEDNTIVTMIGTGNGSFTIGSNSYPLFVNRDTIYQLRYVASLNGWISAETPLNLSNDRAYVDTEIVKVNSIITTKDTAQTTANTDLETRLTDAIAGLRTELLEQAVDVDGVISGYDVILNLIQGQNATITALTAKVAELENKPSQVVRSASLPDDSDGWEVWIQTVEDTVNWEIIVTQFNRTSDSWTLPLVVRKESLPPPSHRQAIEISPNRFEVRLPGGGTLEYSNIRSADLTSFSFPVNTYTPLEAYYLDSEGNQYYRRGQIIDPTLTAMGLGRLSAPSNAITLRYEIGRTGFTDKIVYDVPLL
ncbi:MAG: hypothetical protein ACRC62_15630 [Microcoleus sp.]